METGVQRSLFFTRRVALMPSKFLRAMHPKTEIRGDRESMAKILDAGWIAQMKIHGHRAQVHISADESEPILVYNRQGNLHKKNLSLNMTRELRRLFSPQTGWNVLDSEWLKPEDKLYVFDFLKKEGKLLKHLPFEDRWKLLPRNFISPRIQTLPVYKHVERCLEVFSKEDKNLEGLVFKSPAKGFSDTSIIRCRKSTARN